MSLARAPQPRLPGLIRDDSVDVRSGDGAAGRRIAVVTEMKTCGFWRIVRSTVKSTMSASAASSRLGWCASDSAAPIEGALAGRPERCRVMPYVRTAVTASEDGSVPGPRLVPTPESRPLPNSLEQLASEIGDALAALWWLQTAIETGNAAEPLALMSFPLAFTNLKVICDRLSQSLPQFVNQLRRAHVTSLQLIGDQAIQSYAEFAIACCSERAAFIETWRAEQEASNPRNVPPRKGLWKLETAIEARIESLRSEWQFPHVNTDDLIQCVEREATFARMMDIGPGTLAVIPTSAPDAPDRPRQDALDRSPQPRATSAETEATDADLVTLDQIAAIVDQPIEPAWIISHGGGMYSIGDSEKVLVKEREDELLPAFIDCQTVDTRDIKDRTNIKRPWDILKQLSKGYGGIFAPAIDFHGKKGEGYTVRVKRSGT
jgi:hypothetical protein